MICPIKCMTERINFCQKANRTCNIKPEAFACSRYVLSTWKLFWCRHASLSSITDPSNHKLLSSIFIAFISKYLRSFVKCVLYTHVSASRSSGQPILNFPLAFYGIKSLSSRISMEINWVRFSVKLFEKDSPIMKFSVWDKFVIKVSA